MLFFWLFACSGFGHLEQQRNLASFEEAQALMHFLVDGAMWVLVGASISLSNKKASSQMGVGLQSQESFLAGGLIASGQHSRTA